MGKLAKESWRHRSLKSIIADICHSPPTKFKMSTNSTLPNQQQQDSTWATLSMIAGIFAILLGLVSLFLFARNMFEILSISSSYLFKFLLVGFVNLAMTIVGIIGGVLLLSKNRMGWTLVMMDRISGTIVMVITLIRFGGLPMFGSLDFYTILFLANAIFNIAFVVVFHLPGAQKFLDLKGEHFGLAWGVGVIVSILAFTLQYFFGMF